MLLVAMPGAPSSFLFLVAMPGAPSSVLAPSSFLFPFSQMLRLVFLRLSSLSEARVLDTSLFACEWRSDALIVRHLIKSSFLFLVSSKARSP